MKKIINILISAILILASQSSFAQSDTLKILSWNVFLRPSILDDNQMDRVDSIADYLNNCGADVLILQEVFHRRARKHLNRLLADKYPTQTSKGPVSFFGVPSGVAIYTTQKKVAKTKHYSFKRGKGSDKLAKKGFVRHDMTIKRKRISIIGTHLQAGSGKKRRNIRLRQLDKIETIQKKVSDSTVLIYAGDFNIKYSSSTMDSLREKLQATTLKPSSRFKCTANFSDHELFDTNGNSATWIDFILLRDTERAELLKSSIQEPRQIVEDHPKRLSDHNPFFTHVKLY